ncbi:MAG: hypothetical protein KF773_02260 [Deltaproteobacteria bacterium]|nr:hypothetical protein [Deltaproteobacteria bacterium]
MPLGEGYAQLPANWMNGRPRGLNLPANSDNWTLIYDGEVLLPMGSLELQVDADDRAVVQVALDGKTFGERLFAHNTTQKIAITVPRPDWYPIRAAIAEQGGNARMVLSFVAAGSTTELGPERLRARVTDAKGLVAFAYRGQGFNEVAGETAVPSFEGNFGAGAPPYDLDTGIDNFSVRYTGQVRIDTDGDYTFTVDKGPDPTDGYRLFFDGELVVAHWASTADIATGKVHAAPGWHDLVVDYSDNLGNAQLSVAMSGPGVSGPIASERLRPAVVRGLTAARFETAPVVINDNTTTVVPITPASLPQGARVDWADYYLSISNHPLTNFALELRDCLAPQQLSLATPLQPGSFYYSADARCRDKAAAPQQPWAFRLIDSAVGNLPNTGPANALNYGMAMAYHGGPRTPFATVARYTSPPHPTPGASRLAKISVAATLGLATMSISVRTGADVAALEAAAWTPVENDAELELAGGALMQYRLALNDDGWAYPVIDRVTIDYVVP